MEPIELSGKTFCSNCGLTISSKGAQENSDSPVITQAGKPLNGDQEIPEEPSNDEPNVDELVSRTPITDQTKKELGLDNYDPDALISEIIEHKITPEPAAAEVPAPSPLSAGVKVPVSTPVEEEPKESTPEVAISEIVDQETPQELPEAEAHEELPEDDSGVHQPIDIPDESDFEVPADSTEPTPSFDESVKNADTLSASGILLDILADKNKLQDENAEIDSLEAARDLLKKVKPATGSDTPETEMDESKAQVRHVANILDHEPQNPIEHPELPDPLAELEIPQSVGSEAAGNGDTADGDLYTLPHELVKKNSTIDEKEMIDELEAEIKDAPEPVVTVTEDEKSEYDPDTIAPESVVSPSEATKQEIVTSFFKEKFEDPGKKDQKKSTKSKKNNGFPLWGKIMLILGLILLLLALALSGYYYYQHQNKPTTQIQNAAKESTFTAEKPSEIPYGYEASSSNFDKPNNTLQITYKFANDPTKTISFEQIKTSDIQSTISKILNGSGATYTIKNVDGVEYSELGNGGLVWSKDGFVYKITTVGYSYDISLLYNMAKSVR